MKNFIPIIGIVLIAAVMSAFELMTGEEKEKDTSLVEPGHAVMIGPLPGPGQFFHSVDSRFNKKVTKSEMDEALSLFDLFTENEVIGIETFWDVHVIQLLNGEKIRERSSDENLTRAQMELLHSTDYSMNLCIEAFCNRTNPETGAVAKESFVYYISVIPEKQARYIPGHGAILDYLRKESGELTETAQDHLLEPGKIRFTVSAKGTINKIELESSCGYLEIDEKMLSLIASLPGEWIPAENSKGEKVEQTFVYSFGNMGC